MFMKQRENSRATKKVGKPLAGMEFYVTKTAEILSVKGGNVRMRSGVEWIAAVSVAAGAAAVGYLAYKKFLSKDKCCKAMVNPHIQKDNPKVVHAFDMEDLGDKAVYCRCWRSKKFPLCDGSHTKHNEETGDNVGPLIIKRKEA
ncbi:CDGSH iron-sulfur domain-containing protein 1 isoform X1 [Vidua chalybeata]|uniref:CDGSH iron-sulfur domain-containing protein 1 isoform X1 n=2 Tax=Passeroidea TaxID=175121 RepID=UPI0023A8ECD5|nr:CDGSH iron-sulfur domain-containing protein 1 isoform X1 [Vidua chalybeata]XP_053804709.1 CDGSH iron-sulfur domain-containing protein 1 isoform X1 [Vidua chalybeata]XP_053804710.1 CDGSH iron-sulfur domain-containing protein 1 isoform X1 [Vidua chalybeata]